MTREEFARYIDHSLLAAEATSAQVEVLCQQAVAHGFAAVCVNQNNTATASTLLRGTGVEVCTVIGFPLGATLPSVKVAEAQSAMHMGAQAIDMVVNLGAIKDGDWKLVTNEITRVVKTCRRQGVKVKVIIEARLLTNLELRQVCEIARDAGAAFVKTSTGMHKSGGASVDDVAQMKQVVGDSMGIKASGGIKTYEQALTMIHAGATRIGTTSGVDIMAGFKESLDPKGGDPYKPLGCVHG